jgi:hypothetical protein
VGIEIRVKGFEGLVKGDGNDDRVVQLGFGDRYGDKLGCRLVQLGFAR